MKKKLLSLLSIGIILGVLVGCSNVQTQEKETIETTPTPTEIVTPTPTEEPTPTPTKEPDPLYDLATEQKSRYGANGIYVYELLEILESGETFFLYLENNEGENVDLSNAITWAIEEKNMTFNVPFYLVDFSTLNETEQERILEYFIPGTTYAIKGREVVSNFSKIPETDVDDYTSKYNEFFEKWVYSTMIDVHMHNIEEFITLEEIATKIENKESFAIYVGRDTCKYCKIFTKPMEMVLEEVDLSSPIYYFYTQEYKNNIDNEVENAQETWDTTKETLGIKYTPSFILYKNGVPTYYDDFIGDEYLKANEEKKVTLIEDAKESFYNFLNENEFIIVEENEDCPDEGCDDSCPDGGCE